MNLNNIRSYKEIQEEFKSHYLMQYELPLEHLKSLLIPTKRLGFPGYAGFAVSMTRMPGKEPLLGQPDRWWVVNAYTGHIDFYTLDSVIPISKGMVWEEVTLSKSNITLKELRSGLDGFRDLVDSITDTFFNDEPGANDLKEAIEDSFSAFVDKNLKAYYQALAPDFFSWLEKKS